MSTKTPEIEVAKPQTLDAFWRGVDRDWRSELWNFRVVWHEQTHDVFVRDGENVAGALRLRIAASLAHVEALYVLPAFRRQGFGRALLGRAEEIANYYNAHKVVAEVFHRHDAQAFFEACGYNVEAVIPQHTFKLDVAMLRKFLL
jgi:ribosomal protein S18 acetylase RimI-like enzyme